MIETTSNEMQAYQISRSLPATILLVEDEPTVRHVTRAAWRWAATVRWRLMDP
jgi:hypothetical protein